MSRARIILPPPPTHARQHDIIDPLDHTSGATPAQILQADANGLPVDATNTDAEVAAAAAAAHARQHDIIDPLDHTSGATPGQVLQADANGLPIDATNTDAEVAAAVAAAHAQGTDTALGAVGIKNPPINADKSLYRDSTAGDALVTSTWTQIKAFLKTYFDTVYDAIGSAAAALAAALAALAAHVAITAAGIHGSSVAAAINTLIHRDAAGRAQIVNPAVAADIDNMGARNTAIATHAALITGTHGLGAYGFVSASLAAITLYVDIATGNDADPGTSALPKQTIKGALDALPIAIGHTSTIAVRPGNYPENNIPLVFSRFNTLSLISIITVNSNDETMYDTGLATGGGINFLDDAGAGWSINQFTLGGSAYIWIYEGTGRGQVRQIASNTATRITTTVNWAVNPDATSYYVIGGGATMTGTGAYHAQNVGKNVSILGFAHTGHTAYAFRWMNFSSGALQYNYSSVNGGIVASGYTAGQFYWNYVSGAYAYGLVLGDTFSGTCRASVVKDKTTAQILVYRGALVFMSGIAGQKNYIDHGAAVGIRVDDGSGCLGASAQVFNGGGIAVDPAISTIEPRWWN